MRRVERTRLLLTIVERLAQDEWPTIDLVLGQFGGKRREDWQGSKASYVGWSLEEVDDEAISELAEFFGLTSATGSADQREISLEEVSTIKRIWGEPPGFRLFISHVSAQRQLVIGIKDGLVQYGVSAFVAHADIQPTKEWLDEILRALRTMDALAPVLDEGFHQSNWTDQEVGYAMGRNAIVIPLKLGVDPYGFIGRYQALSCAGDPRPASIALNIARVLILNTQTQATMSEALARRLLRATSYAHSKSLVELLEIPTRLPQSALGHIELALRDNDQVRESWGVPGRIDALFEKNAYDRQLQEPKAADDEIPF